MTDQRIEGAATQAEGQVQNGLGRLTGDSKLQLASSDVRLARIVHLRKGAMAAQVSTYTTPSSTTVL